MNLKEERVTLAHSVRGFNPWSAGPIAFSPVIKQIFMAVNIWRNKAAHLMVTRKWGVVGEIKIHLSRTCLQWPTFSDEAHVPCASSKTYDDFHVLVYSKPFLRMCLRLTQVLPTQTHNQIHTQRNNNLCLSFCQEVPWIGSHWRWLLDFIMIPGLITMLMYFLSADIVQDTLYASPL